MLLYYITHRKGFGGTESEQRAALLRCIADAACAGVDCIQLREKDLVGEELENLAQEAVSAVYENSATTKLLINSHVDIALAIGADGVHLPAGSPPANEIREYWLRQSDREPLIGVSAHSLEDVRQAQASGASFAALAPIFEKAASGAKGIGLEVLRAACPPPSANQDRFRVLALGGVSLANARSCIDAGAAGVAGIRLFQQGDVAETVHQLRGLAPAEPIDAWPSP
jgi:thiamine-phosphate pyrophosphorylase